jgi:hypothetical protein
MTYLEALKGKVTYPLSENALLLALTDRGLTSSDTYAKGRSFDLAYADALMNVVTSPNISEGGYSVSNSDKENLTKVASYIYERYGETAISKPTAKFVRPW